MTNKEYAESLRAIADLYETNEALPQPTYPSWNIYNLSKDDLAKIAGYLKPCDKHYSESFFSLSKKVGLFTLQFSALREDVCERVVLGTRTVTKKVEKEVEPQYEEVEVEEEIVEWRCPDSLMDKEAV